MDRPIEYHELKDPGIQRLSPEKERVMIYTDEEHTAQQIRSFEKPLELAIIGGWLLAFALVMTFWYWALKGLFLTILS